VIDSGSGILEGMIYDLCFLLMFVLYWILEDAESSTTRCFFSMQVHDVTFSVK
jgi:hypothetical protein